LALNWSSVSPDDGFENCNSPSANHDDDSASRHHRYSGDVTIVDRNIISSSIQPHYWGGATQQSSATLTMVWQVVGASRQ
jgi:hypothetical protein